MKSLRGLGGWLADPGSSLTRRVTHGGIWSILINAVNQGLRLVRTVVLARLLAPEDFGLFGITLLALSALERFSQTGFTAALIQKQDESREDLDTAWMIQLIRGVALGALLVAAAPLVASFFEEPGAESLMRALGAVAVVGGFENIGIVYYRKDLEFHKEFSLKLASTLPDLVASIVAAVLLQSAWALLIGLLIGRLFRTAASYVVHPYRPRFRFDRGKARDLFGFGKFVTAQSIVLFVLTEGDDALVGKVLGASSLGLYQIAYLLSNVSARITHLVSRVTFPAYARVQDDRERLNRGLTRTLGVTAFATLPVAGAIGILAPEITSVFLGDKWMPMVPAAQVLCLFGAMRAIGSNFGPVYSAVARLDVPLRINLVQLTVLAIIVYPMTTRWGILGTAGAVTLAMVVALVCTSLAIRRVTGIGLGRLYASVAPPAAGVLAAVVQTYALKQLDLAPGPVVELAALALLGGITYLLVAGAGYRASGYAIDDLRGVAHAMFGRHR